MTKTTTRLTPLGVVVLGLLREREMHPYEMLRLMRQRRHDRLVGGSRGTLYHTVARLQRDALVTEVGVDRAGNRPERTTYAVTSAGRDAADAWVRAHLSRVDTILEFRVALSAAHDLPREVVIALLRKRVVALEAHRADLQAGLAAAHERAVPYQFLVERERELFLVDADARWQDALIERIAQTGDVGDPDRAWGVHELSAETLARLVAFRESVLT